MKWIGNDCKLFFICSKNIKKNTQIHTYYPNDTALVLPVWQLLSTAKKKNVGQLSGTPRVLVPGVDRTPPNYTTGASNGSNQWRHQCSSSCLLSRAAPRQQGGSVKNGRGAGCHLMYLLPHLNTALRATAPPDPPFPSPVPWFNWWLHSNVQVESPAGFSWKSTSNIPLPFHEQYVI